MIADSKLKLKKKPKTSLWYEKKSKKSFNFFKLYERIKMRGEKSKIWEIREIGFRLKLKELILTKERVHCTAYVEEEKNTSWNNWNIELSNDTLIVKLNENCFLSKE